MRVLSKTCHSSKRCRQTKRLARCFFKLRFRMITMSAFLPDAAVARNTLFPDAPLAITNREFFHFFQTSVNSCFVFSSNRQACPPDRLSSRRKHLPNIPTRSSCSPQSENQCRMTCAKLSLASSSRDRNIDRSALAAASVFNLSFFLLEAVVHHHLQRNLN